MHLLPTFFNPHINLQTYKLYQPHLGELAKAIGTDLSPSTEIQKEKKNKDSRIEKHIKDRKWTDKSEIHVKEYSKRHSTR